MRRTGVAAIVAGLALAGLALAVVGLNLRGEERLPGEAPVIDDSPAQRERGAYLALAGNCAGCHTAPGGAAYAGGRGIDTPFGTVYASNLTPDPAHGVGAWNAAEFWRALHHGRSRDGRLLTPAFPYPDYTLVTRDDSDAIFAWLRTLPPVAQPNRPHALRFPYDTQAALAVWRALYFAPRAFVPDPARSPAWNRGAYLVRGLGHCSACHAGRNLLGATRGARALGGGTLPQQHWVAPALDAAHEAGVADWPADDVVALLKTGVTPRASVLGPMAEVVLRSTQHLRDDDLAAIAEYLRSLPATPRRSAPAAAGGAGTSPRGAKIYDDLCADCHGPQGQGAIGAVVALAGNRTVTMDSPANVVRVLLVGGFPPATAGNPRPYGMPPFAQQLDDADIAAVATHIRTAWANAAPPVATLDVLRLR